MPHIQSDWPNQRQREMYVEGGRAFVTFDHEGERLTPLPDAEIPREFTYIEEPSDLALPRYEVDCVHDNAGLLRIMGVHVLMREGGREVISEDLARLRNLEHVIEDAWVAATWIPLWAIGDSMEEVDEAINRKAEEQQTNKRRTVRSLRKRSRSKVPDERFAQAARVYRENRAGGKPTKAVAERMKVPPSTASWLVKQAEDRGLDLGGPRVSSKGAKGNG